MYVRLVLRGAWAKDGVIRWWIFDPPTCVMEFHEKALEILLGVTLPVTVSFPHSHDHNHVLRATHHPKMGISSNDHRNLRIGLTTTHLLSVDKLRGRWPKSSCLAGEHRGRDRL